MADRNSNRRISFNDEAIGAQAAEAAAMHAAAQARATQPSKLLAAWNTAPKDQHGELPIGELPGILESIEVIEGGARRFIETLTFLEGKATMTLNDFETACGELDDWVLMSTDQQEKVLAIGNGALPPSVMDKLTVRLAPVRSSSRACARPTDACVCPGLFQQARRRQRQGDHEGGGYFALGEKLCQN